MSYVLTPAWTTLPTALLPVVKEHLRIDFPDDDSSIKRLTGIAISYFEKFSGLAIHAGAVAWYPPLTNGASRYETPLHPVAAFTVTVDAIDVSSGYHLEGASLTEPVWLVKNDGQAFPAAAVIALTVGFTDPATIDPSILGSLLRITGTLYEHRESVTPLTLDEVPGWASELMSGHWIPRA